MKDYPSCHHSAHWHQLRCPRVGQRRSDWRLHSVSVGAVQWPPLRTLGGVRIRVRFPVAPPYNAEANRDLVARNTGARGESRGRMARGNL